MMRLTERAYKDLEKLPKEERQRIVNALRRYDETRQGDVKPLKGPFRGKYRLRVGNYRVLFRREDGVVVVERILHRRDAYR